jgi:glycosyltransferase involved in cell wall biosynthesis
VIICHDGKDIPALNLIKYPFEVEQIWQEHKGVSAARNACLDHATADYIMFCDCDDMFINMCGLYIVFREMKQGFDSLISMFQEETRHQETKEVIYANHEMDSTFVHGKIHRRQYLINNHIRWNEALTIHEDSYFNILCQNLSQNVKYCQVPFYLWKWRDESVCRHDQKYILKTYRNMLDSNDALIDEFLSRGMSDKAAFFTVFMIFDAYYNMNKPEWINQKNKTYRQETEKRFAKYYKKYKEVWDAVPLNDKMQISNGVRSRMVTEGMQMETMTIDRWLKKIEKL